MANNRRSPSTSVKARDSLFWLEVGAAISSLIGVGGLIAILSQDAHAAEPPPVAKPGFQAGGRPFSNPFANAPGSGSAIAPTAPQGGAGKPPGGGGNFFDDDDEEAGDFPQNPNGASGGNAAGGQTVGGTTPNGVVPHNKVAPIGVDDETGAGAGAKDVITDFNFPDADILDIAKALGKLTGKNFIYDKDVKGRVSVTSNSPITVGDAWKAFLTALDMAGFALIPSGKYIRIARQRDARDKQLKTYTGDYSPDTDALITRVFPLKYINAEEVARTFRSFMPANSRIIPYEQTNTVIVTDTGSNIAKLGKMLEILDVEGYDAGIEVIPVRYASAVELSKLIDTLIPGTGASPGGAPGAPRFGGASRGGGFTARRTKEGGLINTIIADERTNTMIVHANSKGAQQIRALVAKLDQKSLPTTGGGKVHVVYLQYATAKDIAETLNNFSQAAPKAGAPTGAGATGGTGVNPISQSLFEGSIKIAPDTGTNALVVTASPNDFATVQRVINRLDVPRDEVYLEVIALEVTLSKSFDFSANVVAPTSGVGMVTNNDLANFIASPLTTTGAILGFKSGGTQNITINGTSTPVSNVQGLVKLLQSNTETNVLATPQILALDNAEAFFESAEKVQVPTLTQTTIGQNSTFTPYSVPISIKVTPHINKVLNFVKLDVENKFSDITNRAAQGTTQPPPSTLDRTAKATVVVGDGDTVVLGGLVRDRIEDVVSKVPILGDIPLLGWLFKSKHTETAKADLLVFMTPHIIRQYEKVRAILDRKLRDRDHFIETEMGGNDPERGTRDEIIRSLPDIQDITTKRAADSATLDDDTDESSSNDKPMDMSPFTGGKPPKHMNEGMGSVSPPHAESGHGDSGTTTPPAGGTLSPPPGGEVPPPPPEPGNGTPPQGAPFGEGAPAG